jgi:hypothetical protein
MTQLYRKTDAGQIVRADCVDSTYQDLLRFTIDQGAKITRIDPCPFSEHDRIAWWSGEKEGFGFDVLPRRDGPELKPLKKRVRLERPASRSHAKNGEIACLTM